MSTNLNFAKPLPGISPETYNAADFSAVAEIVHAEAGIVLHAGKAMLVYSRLAPLVREGGYSTFSNYIQHIRNDAAAQAHTVAALTTNHTFFYRESHHFEYFEQEIRPAILQKLAAKEPVRLWSAGCSSGEETWSLVMPLLGRERSEGRRIAGQDLCVLASDIAPHALTTATKACYPAKDLEPIPSGLRQLWSKEVDGEATIVQEARSIVRFRALNLLGSWPISRQFDVIFCRNVVIYFDTPTKEQLIARFAEALTPGGYLFVGHSERVTGPAAALLVPVGPTIYQRKSV